MTDFASKLSRRATMAPNDPSRKRHNTRNGNPPKPIQAPLTLAELHTGGLVWRLAWLRSGIDGKPNTGPDTGWFNLKLYALGLAPYKANYWISWNAPGKLLKKWLDLGALGAINPKLLQMVTQVLASAWSYEHYDPATSALYVARWAGEAVQISEDAAYDTMVYGTRHTFTDADLPRIKVLIPLIQAEHGHMQWRRVPDELTGGFSLVKHVGK